MREKAAIESKLIANSYWKSNVMYRVESKKNQFSYGIQGMFTTFSLLTTENENNVDMIWFHSETWN